MADIVDLHIYKRQLDTVAIDPAHVERVESEMFRKSKDRLHEDGHFHCWICGATTDLQVHHRCEWMFGNVVDFAAVKEFCEEWDPYGYGRLLRNKPITSLDDIRVGLVLCQPHHTGVDHADSETTGIGIHAVDFSLWLMQKLALPGAVPIPQRGETIEDVEKRVQAHQRVAG